MRKALLVMDTRVNALSKDCRRRALPTHYRMSTATLNSGNQAVRDGIYNIRVAKSSMLPASKGSSEVLLSNTTSCTLSAASTSFTLPVSNSSTKGPLEARNKIWVAKIDGIKLRAEQLKRKNQKASREGYKRHGVRRQDQALFKHQRLGRGSKLDDILPDVNVVYSSRAVTLLSEVGVDKKGSLSDEHYYTLPVARRRILCRYAKF
jgi:hypothetical protein